MDEPDGADAFAEQECLQAAATEILETVSNVKNLQQAESLSLCLDSARMDVGSIAMLAPNLTELKLHKTFFDSLRELGTSLCNLKVLWITCGTLSNLDGIGFMPRLEELYLPYNSIEDLEPLNGCADLAVLDLEGNSVPDMAAVEWLSMTTQLSELTLLGNPVASAPDYPDMVFTHVPTLRALDDMAVASASVGLAVGPDSADQVGVSQYTSSHPLSQEHALVCQGLREARVGVDSREVVVERLLRMASSVPGQAFSRCNLHTTTAVVPGSAAGLTWVLHSAPSSPGASSAATRSSTSCSTASSSRASDRQCTAGSSSCLSTCPPTACGRLSTPSTPGLYWLKYRVPSTPGTATSGDPFAEIDAEWVLHDSASQLTLGAPAAFQGSAARGLRQWKSKRDALGSNFPVHETQNNSRCPGQQKVLMALDVPSLLDALRDWKVSAAAALARNVDVASPCAW